MIELRNVSVRAGSFALQDVSFKVESGSYAVLMGRTASGKSTLLESICGLRTIHSGQILLQGRDVTLCDPADRGIGYVPQDMALFRSMTVKEHLAFALSIRRWKNEEIRARVSDLAGLLGIEALLERSIAGLSGGEMHRVALGRALSFRPTVLCMDEPLSALDDETRHDMYRLLRDVRKFSQVTVLHVSHSREDARELADCILHLRDGKISSDAVPEQNHKTQPPQSVESQR